MSIKDGITFPCIYGSRNIMEESVQRLQEPEYQQVYYETVSPRNVYINKAEQKAIINEHINVEER